MNNSGFRKNKVLVVIVTGMCIALGAVMTKKAGKEPTVTQDVVDQLELDKVNLGIVEEREKPETVERYVKLCKLFEKRELILERHQGWSVIGPNPCSEVEEAFPEK